MGKSEAFVASAHSWLQDRATINAFVVELPGQIVRAISIFLVQTILNPVFDALFFFVLLRNVLSSGRQATRAG